MTDDNTQPPAETLADEMLIAELRKLYRGLEMSAGLMRDRRRTGGWSGAERTADAFARYAATAQSLHALVSARTALTRRAGGDDAEREALAGYRAAVSFIAADSWDGCSDCVETLKAAWAADWQNDQAADPDETARQLARIRAHRPPVEPCAGGDAIPAGKREGWRKNLAGVKNGSDCYRTIDGVRWFWEPTPPASLKGTGIRHRAAPEGNSFVHPDDIDKLDAHLNGATPKPPAGGDAEAVGRFRQALEDVCDPLGYLQRLAEAEGAKLGGMAYSIANDIATVQRIARDALALPAPVVEGDDFPREKIARLCLSALYGFEFTGDSLCDEADRIFSRPNVRAAKAVALADAIDAALSEGRSHG